jgi:transitional endoplasmic reticulum ATPase
VSEETTEERRAANLWETFARKVPPIAKATRLLPRPELDLDGIGGLEPAKDEILTYACAATHPEVYDRWGTKPPTGLLLIGPPDSGKSLLAEALAVRTGMAFLAIEVPRLLYQLVGMPAAIPELLNGWEATLAEMPATTVLFSHLDVDASFGLGELQPEPPGSHVAFARIAPLIGLVLELVDRTIPSEGTLVVGSTSHPDALPPAFALPGRFERVVDVVPSLPDDLIAALTIHAAQAQERARRDLFDDVDWGALVAAGDDISIGAWVRSLHAALRRKARCEAAGDPPGLVTTADIRAEIERFTRTSKRIPRPTGSYL